MAPRDYAKLLCAMRLTLNDSVMYDGIMLSINEVKKENDAPDSLDVVTHAISGKNPHLIDNRLPEVDMGAHKTDISQSLRFAGLDKAILPEDIKDDIRLARYFYDVVRTEDSFPEALKACKDLVIFDGTTPSEPPSKRGLRDDIWKKLAFGDGKNINTSITHPTDDNAHDAIKEILQDIENLAHLALSNSTTPKTRSETEIDNTVKTLSGRLGDIAGDHFLGLYANAMVGPYATPILLAGKIGSALYDSHADKKNHQEKKDKEREESFVTAPEMNRKF